MTDLNQKVLDRTIGFQDQVLLTDAQGRINSLLMRLDLVAHRAEIRWGVGRLEKLAPPELREKWERQVARLNEAVVAGDPEVVAALVESSVRGWAALEKAAVDAGHQTYQPEVWEVAEGGRMFWVCRSMAEAHAAVGRAPAGTEIMAVEELVRVYLGRHAKTFEDAQKALPGGVKHDSSRGMDEEIPF